MSELTSNGRTVLIVGGVSWNTMVYVPTLPEPVEQTLFPSRVHDTVGSSGAGKALNLGRLLPTTLFGLVGADVYGQMVIDYFDAQPVRFLHQLDPAGTKRHVNLMASDGSRISVHVNSGTHDLAVDWGVLREALAAADFLSITAYNYTRRLLPLLSELNLPLWLDIHDYDGRNPHWDDYLAAARVIQLSSTNFADYRAWMERMIDEGKEAVICTHGTAGASLLTAEEGWLEIPALVSSNVVDTNGAGDSFFAGVLYGRAANYDWLTSLRFGALIAKMTVESAELYHPQLTVDQLLAQYHQLFFNQRPPKSAQPK